MRLVGFLPRFARSSFSSHVVRSSSGVRTPELLRTSEQQFRIQFVLFQFLILQYFHFCQAFCAVCEAGRAQACS